MRKGLILLAGCLALGLLALPAAATPLSVTISGPSAVTIGCGCGNVNWTAVPAGGDPPYIDYAWKVNGSSVPGSTSSLTRTYCNNTTHEVEVTDVIGVTVTDSNGREASATKTTVITLTGC